MNGRRSLGIYAGLGWIFVACLVAQLFLAGLGVFDRATGFAPHREFGYLFGWLTLGLVVAALAGRLGRRLTGYGLAMLVLFALQSLFVALRVDAPFAAALHPVNGVLILLVAIRASADATRLARAAGAVHPPAVKETSHEPSTAQPA